MKSIRIGSGAGFAGDRVEPSLRLIKDGCLDYIIYECLAERTIALGQTEKMKNAEKGYNDLLEMRLSKALPLCYEHKVKLITNMGAANPVDASIKCVEIASKLNLSNMKVACVMGDDVLPVIEKYDTSEIWELHKPVSAIKSKIVSANVYLGVDGIVDALKSGADVIITGRVADPSLFLAPAIYEFGWKMDDWDKLGKGTIMGHMLECGAQVMGGYYAEPGKKDVPNIENLGLPIGEMQEDGTFYITKLPDDGGIVNQSTCSEQICYEIHDPENYITPDVVADCKQISFVEVDKDKILVKGVTGKPKTETLKCSIGYSDCFIGEGEISYGGHGCVERAKLCIQILKDRINKNYCGQFDEIKYDIIGYNSLFWGEDIDYITPNEVRVRVAARSKCEESAKLIPYEVEALYTNGPAGGGGVTKRVRKILSVASILINRRDVSSTVKIFNV